MKLGILTLIKQDIAGSESAENSDMYSGHQAEVRTLYDDITKHGQ